MGGQTSQEQGLTTRRRRLSGGRWWAIGVVLVLGALVGASRGCLAVAHSLSDMEDNTYLESADFTPDGRLLLTTTGGEVRVWSVATEDNLKTLQIKGDARYGGISPRGELLAVSRWDTKVDLWDIKSGHRVHRFFGLHSDSVSFSPNGRLLLVVGRDDRVRIVNVASGRLVYRFRAGDATFASDGRFIVAADGRRVQIRSLDTGRPRLTVRGKPGTMWLGGLSPDGRVLLTLGGYRGRLWDARSGRLLHTVHVAKNIDGYSELDGAVFTRDGRQLLVYTAESNELWNVASGRRTANFDDSFSSTLSPDGRLLATDSYSGGLQIRSLPTAAILRVLRPGEGDPIYSMTFSPDSRLLVTTGDEDATVWDVASGRTVFVLHHDVP